MKLKELPSVAGIGDSFFVLALATLCHTCIAQPHSGKPPKMSRMTQMIE
jgi:hypothetical protein